MKGRVAVLRAYGGEFELREYPLPDVEPGGDPRARQRAPRRHLQLFAVGARAGVVSHVFPLERMSEGFR